MAPQINIVISALNQTQTGFAGVQAGLANITVSTQQATSATSANTAAQTRNATSARTIANLNQQLARTAQQVELASTDAAGRVRILTENYERLAAAARKAGLSEEQQARASLAASRAQLEMTRAQNRSGNGGLGPALPRTLEELGAGALGQFGAAVGVAALEQKLVAVTQESAQLAIQAQTIGRAYESATERAGIGADNLLAKLRQASRQTVSDVSLQAAANKALALGVGSDTQQIADILAIARQKGKDFGESTQQAFEDITIGLGRLSPRILDNLGIILDEDAIYKEYAQSIGAVAGKLTDQKKRQALVNDLIKNNTDLIATNAQAALDASDKFAQAEARRQAAKTRFGTAALPTIADVTNTGAGAADLLSGGLSGKNILNALSPDGSLQGLAATGAGLMNPSTMLQTVFRVLGEAENSAVRDAQGQQSGTTPNEVINRASFRPTVAPPPRMTSGPYANLPTMPQAAGNVTNNYITVNNAGSVVTHQELTDSIHAGLLQKQQRGGVTGR